MNKNRSINILCRCGLAALAALALALPGGCTTEAGTNALSPQQGQEADAAALAEKAAAIGAGGVLVSDQNDCTVGPTNVNHLASSQTAYVWLIFNAPTTIRDLTYQIVGTNHGNTFDSGILTLRFTQCRTGTVNDLWARITTPDLPGTYQLTVFNQAGKKISSDNFSID